MESFSAPRLHWESLSAGSRPDKAEALERSGHSAVVSGRHVYILGGRRRHEWLGDVLRLNLETREWETLPPVPFGARSHFSATQIDRQVWIVGGSGKEGIHGTVHVLDLSTHQWHEVAVSGEPGLLARCAHTAVPHPSKANHILLFGGIGSDQDGQRYLGDIVELRCDLRGAKAARVVPVGGDTVPRAYHTMTAMGHRCFAVGGKGSTGDNITGDSMMTMYDASNNRWCTVEVVGDVPCPRSSHAAVVWRTGHEDRVVLFGGSAKGKGKQVRRLADTYSFKYLFGQVICRREISSGGGQGGGAAAEDGGAGEAQPCARASHLMVGLGDSLLLSGGYSGAEVYTGDLWMATYRPGASPAASAGPPAWHRGSPTAVTPGSRTAAPKTRSRLNGMGSTATPVPMSLSPPAWQKTQRQASSPQAWQRKKPKLACSVAPPPAPAPASPPRGGEGKAAPPRSGSRAAAATGKNARGKLQSLQKGRSRGGGGVFHSPDEVEDPDASPAADEEPPIVMEAAPEADTVGNTTKSRSSTPIMFSSAAAGSCGLCTERDLDLQRLQGQLCARVEVENHLRSEKSQLEAQVAELQRRLDAGDAAQRQTVDEYTTAQGRHSREMAAMKIEIDRQAQDAARAQGEAEAAKRDRGALEAKLAEGADELRAARGTADELRRERDKWQEAGSSANRDLEGAKAELQRERRALNELGAEHDRVGKRLQEMEDMAKQHQRELNEVKQRSCQNHQAMKRAEEQVREVVAQYREADQRVQSLDRELHRLRDVMAQQSRSDQDRIDAANRSLQQKEAELSRLSTQCCNLQADLATKSNTLRQLELEFNSLAGQVSASVTKARAWLQPGAGGR